MHRSELAHLNEAIHNSSQHYELTLGRIQRLILRVGGLNVKFTDLKNRINDLKIKKMENLSVWLLSKRWESRKRWL